MEQSRLYAFLRDLVTNKKYITIKMTAAGESFLNGNLYAAVRLEDCWIEIEGADLSVEDGASLVRPSGTIHANWVSWCDDDVAGGMGLLKMCFWQMKALAQSKRSSSLLAAQPEMSRMFPTGSLA